MYDSAEFPDLVTKYEKLNWRIVSKPGGATMKPDHFYQLYGCVLFYSGLCRVILYVALTHHKASSL